ncbi:MAG: hypothetical protein AAF449_14530, partial [Myxococcota bacterium]
MTVLRETRMSRIYGILGSIAALSLACGGGDDREGRAGITVLTATPQGLVDHTVPIEFMLSAEVTEPSERPAIALHPPLPLLVKWVAPDRVVAIPQRPYAANTRYVARLVPSALGPKHLLSASPALRFHTPLFAVDLIDASLRKTDEAPTRIDRVWLSFTHSVRRSAIEKYVVLRRDSPLGLDLAFQAEPEDNPRAEVSRRWELSLASPEAKIRVEIPLELTPTVGGHSLGKRVVFSLDAEARPALEIAEARTQQVRGRLSVVLPSTRRLADEVPTNAVRVEPAVGVRARTDGRTLVLEGDFRPEQEYKIKVDALTAQDGSELASTFETTLVLPALTPQLHIRRVEPVLSPTDVDPIVVESVQVEGLRARTFSVPVDNLVHVLGDLGRPGWPRWPSVGRWTGALSIAVSGAEGTAVRLPDETRPGLRLLEIRAKDQPWLADYRWIQAGWAVTAKQGVRRVRVQVLTAAERRPVRGVQIRLRTRANRPIGPVLTDASGVAEVRHAADDPVELVVATRQGETAILDLTSTASRQEAGPLHAGEGVEAFVLPSQDRFRRGDKLPILIVSRQTGLVPVEKGQEVQVSLRGPDGRQWAKQSVRLWRSGGARLDFKWPTNATNGLHSIEAVADGRVIGRAKVRLQDQQALVSEVSATPEVQTSTGSPRLSWTPERPRPGEALQVRWLSPGPGWVTVSLEGTDVVAEVRRLVGQGPSTFSLTVPQAAKPGAHLVVT